jgi:hypothetical protein
LIPVMLPYIEQQSLYNQINFAQGVNCRTNESVLQAKLPGLHCPTDPSPTVLPGRGYPSNAGCTAGAASLNATVTHYLGSFGDGCIVGENVGFTNAGDASYNNFRCGGCSPGSCNGSATSTLCTQPSNGFGGGQFHRGMFNYMSSAASVHGNGRVRISDVRDGTSNTIMFGHTSGIAMGFDNVWCTSTGSVNGTGLPINYNIQASLIQGSFYCPGCSTGQPWRGRGFQSHHPGGSIFTMADGSTRFLTQTTEMKVYNALGSRAGGDVATLPTE